MYEEKYREILTRTRESGANLVLIDPFYISTETQPGTQRRTVLDMLPPYLDVVERLAAEFNALHVRTHQLYAEQLKYRASDIMCPEPVHPNATGHLVIAHDLLQKLNW
jgi:lysophospholipase L1-like esterase